MPSPNDYNYKNIYKKHGVTNSVFNSPKPMRKGQSHMSPKPKGWTLRQAVRPLIDYGRRKKIDLNRYIKGGR